MRWIIAIAIGTGLAISLPFGGEAEAAKARKMSNKQCIAKALDGKQSTFKCSAAQKCCFDYVLSQGKCVAASDICL